MRSRNDAQDISIYAIHECKRKAAHRESSVTFIENFPNARRVAEQLGQTLRFCKEFGTKPRAAKFSEGHCRCELLLRCGVKLGPHFLICSRRRAKTCSEGVVLAVPESISSERRRTSSSHAASTSGYAGPSSSSQSTRSNVSFSAVLRERTSSSIMASGRAMPWTVPATTYGRNTPKS